VKENADKSEVKEADASDIKENPEAIDEPKVEKPNNAPEINVEENKEETKEDATVEDVTPAEEK
jgi:hypothetical protein